MFGTIIKYGLVMLAGATATVVTMHYGDNKLLDEVEHDLEVIRDQAKGAGQDPLAKVEEFVLKNYKDWVNTIVLTMNLKELDAIIASAKA